MGQTIKTKISTEYQNYRVYRETDRPGRHRDGVRQSEETDRKKKRETDSETAKQRETERQTDMKSVHVSLIYIFNTSREREKI